MSDLIVSCQTVPGSVQASLFEQNFDNNLRNTNSKFC